MPAKKKYYVISKAKLHEEVKNKMFTTYKPVELPEYDKPLSTKCAAVDTLPKS